MAISDKHVTFFLLLGILLFASYQTLMVSSTITKEEAIEISRSSPTMQEYIEKATDYFLSEAEYLNVTMVKSMKEQNIERYGSLPDDHGVWEIVWGMFLKPYGIDFTSLWHYIDGETGEILLELRGVIFT